MNDKLFIQLIDNMIDVINNKKIFLENNESQTRWLLVDYLLLDVLRYNREDIIVEFDIEQDERSSKYNKSDYAIVLDNKVKFIIEAKALGVDLFRYKEQLEKYFYLLTHSKEYSQKELTAILSDGNTYLFFTDSKEKGIMDSEPFLNITLSNNDELEILKLKEFSKINFLENQIKNVNNEYEEYDLKHLYRIDIIENIINCIQASGNKNKIIIDYLYFNDKKYYIKNFKSMYKMILKYVAKNKPEVLKEMLYYDDKDNVDSSIKKMRYYSFKRNYTMFEVSVDDINVYTEVNSLSNNNLISKTIQLLDVCEVGRFNLMLKLKLKEN